MLLLQLPALQHMGINSLISWPTLSLTGLTVTIDGDYISPPDFVGGPNDYRAASGVTLTCQVEGGSGAVTYLWSSTCTGAISLCFVQTQIDQIVSRSNLRSSDSGTHTCLVTDSANGQTGSATIEMNVVGE